MNKVGFWLTFAAILLVDQLSKFFAVQHLRLGQSVTVIPNFFDLTLVYNPGAAFGLFANLPDMVRRAALLFVSIVALAVVGKLILKDSKDDKISVYALCGILAGAVGNILDRVRFDAVVDFFDFYLGSYHWPAFNVADSAICVGVTVLAIRLLFAQNTSRPSEIFQSNSPS